MKFKLLLLLLLPAGLCFNMQICAQAHHQDLTIVYNIVVSKSKKSSGIEETYNGGTKTIFITHNKARIRLVSMMRIESMFFTFDSLLKETRIIKESGTNKYQYKLSADEWEQYNSKYSGATCDTLPDTLTIAGYHCKKAILHLLSGRKIITYYSDSISIGNQFVEPAFRCIPGTVLQYEYVSKRGIVVFKASEVKRGPISKDVFTIPAKDILNRKYLPGKRNSSDQVEDEN